MSVHAHAQERATVEPAGVFTRRQRGRLSHAIVHFLALSALMVLVLGSLVVVLWTEPYPSMLIGVAVLAVALWGAWRLSHRVATTTIVLLLLSTAGIAVSQFRVYTPPISNIGGDVLAGSIASIWPPAIRFRADQI